MITFETTISGKKQLTADVFLFTFTFNSSPQFTFSPGQYVILFIPQLNGVPARRLYSIASPPNNLNSFELLIQCVPNGVAGAFLLQSKINDNITAQGPAGMFTLSNTDVPLLFLATGTGIAPIRSLLYSLPTSSLSPVHLYWGLKTISDAYFLEEIITFLQSHKRVSFSLCLSRQENMSSLPAFVAPFVQKGRVTDFLDPQKELPNTQYYICGGKLVVESLKDFLAQKGVEKERIHFEKFT